MKKYDHLRVAARKWRLEGLSIDEICNQLSLSKGTVYHWIKDIPLQRKSRSGQNLKTERHKNNKYWERLRNEAYQKGVDEYNNLCADPTFRDFIVLYLTEGYRRSRNCVDIVNSNPSLIQLAAYWFRKLTIKKWDVRIAVHTDQDLKTLTNFWANILKIEASCIKLKTKSNSGNLSGRKWRSINGILSLRVGDTYFRSRLQAWMDIIEKEYQKVA